MSSIRTETRLAEKAPDCHSLQSAAVYFQVCSTDGAAIVCFMKRPNRDESTKTRSERGPQFY